MRLQIFSKLLHHHLFVIRPVADVHLRNGLAFEVDDVVLNFHFNVRGSFS